MDTTLRHPAHRPQAAPVLLKNDRLAPLRPPRIVAETDAWLVVDKPAFMAAHPSKPGDDGTLWDELRALLSYELANGGQVSLINRLDRETSGLTLVAKTAPAARELHRCMESRGVRKEYLAIVEGWPTADAWTVDGPLLRQGEVRESRVWVKQIIHSHGTPAVTDFTVVRRFERGAEKYALIHARPATGRMHQIRVHLAHSGHFIIGDKLYGPSEECYLEFIETGWTPSLAARLRLPRQALHSAVLGWEENSFSSPLPPELADWTGENAQEVATFPPHSP